MSPQIREILLLRDTEPELADIKIQQMRIGLDFVEALGVYRAALRSDDTTERDRSRAMATLRDLAAARFDAELRAKQYEIDRLRNRLGELENSVEQIEQRREAEIEHMLATAVRSARRQAVNTGEASGND